MTNEFRFPAAVQGWLNEDEGLALAEAARGRRVLEIGSFQGRSTICLAQTASHVDTIDNHEGDAGTQRQGMTSTVQQLEANLTAYGVREKVTVHVCDAVDADLSPEFEMAFVDGSHEQPDVESDLRIAQCVVKPGGVLAMHDWDYESVQLACAAVFGTRNREGVTIGRTRIQKIDAPAATLVFLAIPSRGGITLQGLMATHAMGKTLVHCIRGQSCSLLAKNFNSLWCQALNERRTGISHFCMLHDDIQPLETAWLDKIMKEFRESGADILSVAVPIKDSRGLSSTAIYNAKQKRMRRLTMKEIAALPPTFDAAGAGYPGCVLLPNTGLWVCDFTKPWVEKICFTVKDRIIKTPQGTFTEQCWSEDWDFGVQAQQLGLRVCVTSALKVTHKGEFDYPNFGAWGECQTDPAAGTWQDWDAPEVDYSRMPEPIFEPPERSEGKMTELEWIKGQLASLQAQREQHVTNQIRCDGAIELLTIRGQQLEEQTLQMIAEHNRKAIAEAQANGNKPELLNREGQPVNGVA